MRNNIFSKRISISIASASLAILISLAIAQLKGIQISLGFWVPMVVVCFMFTMDSMIRVDKK